MWLAVAAVLALAGCGRIWFDPIGAEDGGVEDGASGADAAQGDASGDAGAVEPNVMFVTSFELWPAGIDEADLACEMAAIGAGLSGTYRAWISTSAVHARDRIRIASGWVRSDGLPFTNSVEDLLAGVVFYPPLLDENGDMPGRLVIATGTGPDGLLAENCEDWTMSSPAGFIAGHAGYGSEIWTSSSLYACTGPQRVYCFGVDRIATVAPPPPTGPLAFVTAGSIRPPTDVGVADALCQAEAEAAGYSGRTFLALLPRPGDSPIGRFTASEWFRVDGVRVVFPTISAFDVSADGTRDVGGLSVIWSGADTARTVATTASTCNDWMDMAGVGASLGNFHSALEYSNTPMPCTNEGRVRCLEQ